MSLMTPSDGRLLFIRWAAIAIVAGLMAWLFLWTQNLFSMNINPYPDAIRALKANKIETATKEFDRTVTSGPTDKNVYLVIADACNQGGHPELSIRYLEKAVQNCKYVTNPERALLYEAEANTYSVLKQPVKAIYAAQRAVDLDPDNPDYLNTYGYMLTENAQTEADLNDALVKLTHALGLLKNNKGNDWETNYKRCETEDSYGWVLCKKREYPKSVTAMIQAISDIPEMEPDAFFESGAVKEMKKIKAKQYQQTYCVLYYHLGAAYTGDKKFTEAKIALLTSLRYDNNYTASKELLKVVEENLPVKKQEAPPSKSVSAGVHDGSSSASKVNPPTPVSNESTSKKSKQ